MEALIAGDNDTGLPKLRETLPLFKGVLNDCEYKKKIEE